MVEGFASFLLFTLPLKFSSMVVVFHQVLLITCKLCHNSLKSSSIKVVFHFKIKIKIYFGFFCFRPTLVINQVLLIPSYFFPLRSSSMEVFIHLFKTSKTVFRSTRVDMQMFLGQLYSFASISLLFWLCGQPASTKIIFFQNLNSFFVSIYLIFIPYH